MIFIIVAISSCGPAWASFGVNHLDIGGSYAGILMGLSNCIGSMPGFLIPTLTGYLVEHPQVSVARCEGVTSSFDSVHRRNVNGI
jgi:hypothetical protein